MSKSKKKKPFSKEIEASDELFPTDYDPQSDEHPYRLRHTVQQSNGKPERDIIDDEDI